MNATVALVIITVWAVAATTAMILALRSRASSIKTLAAVRKDRDEALVVAREWKTKYNDLTIKPKPYQPKPARDGSDGLRARQSLVTAARKLATPAKPTSARTPPTSRQDPSTDTLNATGGLVASTLWVDSSPTTDHGNWGGSSDSGSTSSSSDGGSCGGGE